MSVLYRIGEVIIRIAAEVCFSYRSIHEDRIPKEGGVILAMNHESYLDPPLAGICSMRPVYYLGRKTLQNWPLLGSFFPKVNVILVDQERADMSALKTVIRLVRAGEPAVIFPEGSRTLDGSMLPALPGLGMIIAKTLAPVVPLRIFGAREAFPRGSSKVRFCPITVMVGEPMYFTEADLVGPPREVYQRLANQVMERIAALRNERNGIDAPG